MSEKKKVAVIFGGQSPEHEVSANSAQSVLKYIDREKYDVTIIGITKEGCWLHYDGPIELLGNGEWKKIAEEKALAGMSQEKTLTVGENSLRRIIENTDSKKDIGKIDVVFPVLHGCNGEDGTIQGLFELVGIPYVGCGVLGSALGMDKVYSKVIFEAAGIPQGKYLVFTRKEISHDVNPIVKLVEETLTYPCFVKPSNTGSSVGVTKAHNREELIDSLGFAAKYDRKVLVEEFIDGMEIECSVLGNDQPAASLLGQIIPCNEFYDYNAKYKTGDDSEIIIPAPLPENITEEIRQYAVRAFRALDCSGIARADFFVQKGTKKVYINELNTMPGFTRISMYPKLWEASGLPYPKLIEKLIELAFERFEDNKREITN